MSLFLPTSDDVNKLIFLPAFALLALELSISSPQIPFGISALVYTILAGIFQEFTEYSDKSILTEMGNEFLRTKDTSKGTFIIALSLIMSLIFFLTLALLLKNYEELKGATSVVYLLYYSILIANIFFVSRMISFPVLAFIEIDFHEAMDEGALNYLENQVE